MDIFEFAMQMEQDGAKFYRELAEKTTNNGIKNILNQLVDAELKHYDHFHDMEQTEHLKNADAEILSNVKNIFVQMKEDKENNIDDSELHLYEKALEIEKKSEKFFREKAEEVDDPAQKELLLKIADEEKSHCIIIQNIVNFVARPEQWLENAEWTHLEEY